jgi:two-component system LytT family response regulator
VKDRQNQSLRILIVDDEAPARELLSEYLEKITGCEIVASCADGFEAVRLAGELEPDLMILDIQMPKLDGFDVIELLSDPPPIIFSTAFEEHAIRAFEVAAADYLLKPFSQERLGEAIDRVRQRRLEHPRPRPPLPVRPETSRHRRVLVREGPKIHVVPTERIDYVESQDDYIRIHTGGLELSKKQTLTSLEKQLDPDRFVRVHRCFLINLDRIDRLEPYSRESRVAILADGTRIPVSRSGYARLRKHL